MNLFDAINHSFAAVSTGGFSTHPESIAHWDSVAIETLSIVLMILGNMNFLTGYLLITGKFKAVYRNSEIRVMTFLIPISFLIVLLLVTTGIFSVIGKSIRAAIFEPVSALTTTGFSTVSYNNWNAIGWLVLIVLMLIGGGTCSTAGGIKQYRVYLLYKSLIWELRRTFFPRTTIIENYVWQGEYKDYIKSDRINQIAIFIFVYFVTYILGVGILLAHGFGFQESLFEFASALSNSGLSIGITSSSAPASMLWTETIGMFLGRLEFFVIFTSIGKVTRDIFLLIKK
jgi:trk system potassium uptake protein TrkH